MNSLNVSNINLRSPYTVWEENGEYVFISENNILYAVGFEYDDSIRYGAFWLNIINRSQKKSPNDKKLQYTIICIIEEFFRVNPNILLYVCDSANSQQAMRSRLFLRWFNSYSRNESFIIKIAVINDDGEDNYVAMIVQRSNSQIDEILKYYEDEIAMFTNKTKKSLLEKLYYHKNLPNSLAVRDFLYIFAVG